MKLTKKQLRLLEIKIFILVFLVIAFFAPIIPLEIPIVCITSPGDPVIEYKTLTDFIYDKITYTSTLTLSIAPEDESGLPPPSPYQFTYTLVDEELNPIGVDTDPFEVGHFVSFSISEFRDEIHSVTYDISAFGVPTGTVNVSWKEHTDDDLVVALIVKLFISDSSVCPSGIFDSIYPSGSPEDIVQKTCTEETFLQSEKFVFDVPDFTIAIFPFTYFDHTFVMKEPFIPLPEIIIPVLETPTGINSLYYIIGGAVVACIVIMVLLLRNRKW